MTALLPGSRSISWQMPHDDGHERSIAKALVSQCPARAHAPQCTSRSRQTDLHSPHAALGPRAASRQLSSALAANAVLARFPVLRGCFVAGAALLRPLFTTLGLKHVKPIPIALHSLSGTVLGVLLGRDESMAPQFEGDNPRVTTAGETLGEMAINGAQVTVRQAQDVLAELRGEVPAGGASELPSSAHIASYRSLCCPVST